ncbi:MAG: hypothetical protein QOG63_448 [Thermoleophilaceae bacterium]|nr:hypothetical protein [Thermoleophilaceae bacterium]
MTHETTTPPGPVRKPRSMRVLALTVTCLAAFAVGLVVERGLRSDEQTTAYRVVRAAPLPDSCQRGVDPSAAWPPACWRPYSPESPFNRPVPAGAPTAAGSRAAVARLASFGPPGRLVAGVHETAQDWSKPTYYASPGDPLFRVHCTRPWGHCGVEGAQLRIPERARPAAGGDGHMTVIDPDGRTEYDFWKVAAKPSGGGTLEVGWGGRTSLAGDGRGSAAVAAGFGNLAGLIRAPELEAGRIDHALFMTVHCTSGQAVYPAANGNLDGACASGRAEAPPLGARFVLDMSDAEIDALGVPPWKRAILTAMAHYGMFVGDTTGASWGIQVESDATYTSLGRKPLFETFARDNGFYEDRWPAAGNRTVWVGDLAPDVDWQGKLRVVGECVSRGSC